MVQPIGRADEPEHYGSPFSPFAAWYVAAAFASGAGLVGKASLLAKLTHLSQPIALTLLVSSLFFCLLWPLALRFRMVVAPLVLSALFASFLLLYPKMNVIQKMGRGSDQAECVVLGAQRMAHGQWPYERSAMSSSNAMSCGPGWVAAQTPAIALFGYKWNLALCWALSVGLITYAVGWNRTAAIVSLVGLCPGIWLTAINGTDFLTFGIVILAATVFLDSAKSRQMPALWAIAALGLGLIAQFRAVTLLISAFFSQRLGRGPVIAAWMIATVTQVAFLLWHPQAFINDGPLHLALKLMRTSVLSENPVLAALELSLVSAIGFAAVLSLARSTRYKQPLLLFLWIVFFLPGCEDLLIKYSRYGNLLDALGYWEGSIWMTACVPLGAAILATNWFHAPPFERTVREQLPIKMQTRESGSISLHQPSDRPAPTT